MPKGKKFAITVNILLKREEDTYVAHCLELDIMGTANTLEQVKRDMVDLISAQVDYAFANNNLDNLFRPAPPSVWREFYLARELDSMKHRIKSSFSSPDSDIPPPWIVSTLRGSGLEKHG